MSSWTRLSFVLPADQEEWFSIELWARGATGVQISEATPDRVRLQAYFPDPLPFELAVREPLWATRGMHLSSQELIEEEDWLATYRRSARPFDVGERFRIDPGEHGDAVPQTSRIVLRVPARRAFGTGSHESTQLILEWLESLDLSGTRLLDLGTGTGILAMAARRLGAVSVVGLDADPQAVVLARENGMLNATSVQLAVGGLSCLGQVRFDLALVNIIPANWISEASSLARILTADGQAILSGITTEDGPCVSDVLGRADFEVVERRSKNEWMALCVRRC